MARLTTLQKVERTVKLLLGMRIPRVAQQLAPYGFGRATLEDGWARVVALGLASVELPRSARPAAAETGTAALLSQLDAFENTWFPIARRSLESRHPQIAERLFQNIPQSRGAGSALTVMLFLERLAALERGEAPYGADGRGARRLLRERGLSKKKENAARDLLARLRDVESAPAAPALDPEQEEHAAEAMWTWYLEWSAIARVAIDNRTLLKALGFTPRGARSAKQALESAAPTVPEPPPARSSSRSRTLGARPRRRTQGAR